MTEHSRILVEVDRDEADTIARILRTQSWASEQRLADRFELAASTKDEPTPLAGQAIVIGKVMT